MIGRRQHRVRAPRKGNATLWFATLCFATALLASPTLAMAMEEPALVERPGVRALVIRSHVPVPRRVSRDDDGMVRVAALAAAGAVSSPPAVTMAEAIRRELTVDVSLSVADAYAVRGFAPIWKTEASRAALWRRLSEAAHDGLDPADYRVELWTGNVRARAWTDVAMTEAALKYARHLYGGRADPSAVWSLVSYEPRVLNERAFLRRLASGDVERAFRYAEPRHAQYHALRERLVAHLSTQRAAPVPLGPGPNLSVGRQGPRVAVLRRRLGMSVRRGTDPTLFDAPLADAVKAYQRAEGLSADGIVGPRTRERLDSGMEPVPVEALILNMERWRWMPKALGTSHVRVNVPAFRVRVVHEGALAYDGKVIVGTPANPTPIFSDKMEHIVVNPYWNVPYSIASNEMLGGIQANPAGYFARRGYEVVHRGRVVNPTSIAWSRESLRKVRIRQRPGRGNALGAVKFMFPNKYAVYLHDTPTKRLFNRASRAYSHGCVRVDQPFAFAEALLANETLSGGELQQMVGGGARHLPLSAHIPVHLSYFTVEVTADGRLVRYGDVYGLDARTERAMNL